MSIITPLSSPGPTSSDPSTFDPRADLLFGEELPRFIEETAELEAALGAAAAPGGLMIPYLFDSATGAADPGTGDLRLNNATQASATAIYADLTSAIGTDATALLDKMGVGTSAVKGQLRISKVGDPTKFLLFDVTSVTTPGGGGYREIAVSGGLPAGASPFTAADALTISFARVGDRGGFPAYDLLATTTISSPVATVTFASISDAYSDLMFTLDGVTLASGTYLTVSVFDGSTWATAEILYPQSAVHTGEIWLPGYQRGMGAGRVVQISSALPASPAVVLQGSLTGSPADFVWRATPRISGVRFAASAVNLTAGTINLYGH